jgi:medium-chain acyl-[acyl-carrier-protein] hydrolase
MLKKLEQKYELRAMDVDIRGEWMPSAIFVRMQEIAEDHATAVGFGRVNLIDTFGFAWVLTRMHVRMRKYPRLGETIRVSTWPLKPTRLIFLRNFMFHNQTGEELGRAVSQWVLFDMRERTLRRTHVLGEYPFDPDAPILLPNPAKIILPSDMQPQGLRRVLYSDVDMNGHMNNTKYLNWICELFPVDILKQCRLSDIRINYIAEAYLDQDVCLLLGKACDDYYICGKTEGKTVFDACVTWE